MEPGIAEDEPGRTEPLDNSMSARGCCRRESASCESLSATTTVPSWNCRMGRVAAEVRSTHFQSSFSVRCAAGRRSWSRDTKTESSSIRTSVVKFALTLMCCSIVGRKPASVTFTEYRPGRTRRLVKSPFWSVSSCITKRPSAASGLSETVAPIWGVFAGSNTIPASLP